MRATWLAVGAVVVALMMFSGRAGVAQGDGCSSTTAPTCDYGSGDQLVIPSLAEGADRCGQSAINAVVNVYDVGSDGQLGIPVADCDLVRENMAALPGYGGYPGNGGTTVLAGHVDYHPNYTGVFWNLTSIQTGAEVDYYRADGTMIAYKVDWASNIGDGVETDASDPNYDPNFWSDLTTSSTNDTLVLITCSGDFDPATHSYNNRFVVHAVRSS